MDWKEIKDTYRFLGALLVSIPFIFLGVSVIIFDFAYEKITGKRLKESMRLF